MLTDRREALSRRRVQTVNRLHALLAELLPGQAKKDITPLQAKAMLARVRPRDIAGKTGRSIAAEELAELVAVDAKIKKATAELKVMVLARGSRLRIFAVSGRWWRPGSWPMSVTWPGSPTATGSHPGPAPHPWTPRRVSENRHRLSRAGNRRINHMIHIAAVTQIRLDTEGRASYRRKRAEGKKPLEAMRRLKRRISDAIYRQLLADQQRAADAKPGAGQGGHCGASWPCQSDLAPL